MNEETISKIVNLSVELNDLEAISKKLQEADSLCLISNAHTFVEKVMTRDKQFLKNAVEAALAVKRSYIRDKIRELCKVQE